MPGLLHFGRKAGARFLVHFLPPQSLHRDKALLSISLKLVVFLHRPLDFARFRKQAARFACVDFASSAQWRCFRLGCRTHEAIRGKP